MPRTPGAADASDAKGHSSRDQSPGSHWINVAAVWGYLVWLGRGPHGYRRRRRASFCLSFERGRGGWFSPVYAIVRPFRCRVDRGKERYGEKHVYF